MEGEQGEDVRVRKVGEVKWKVMGEIFGNGVK